MILVMNYTIIPPSKDLRIKHGAIEFYEDDKKAGITFKKGIDPQVVMNAIKKIDG